MSDAHKGDDVVSPGGKEDHKQKNLNLLLLRVKEKLAALQLDYDKQSKELTDLKTTHNKLQTQHMNLTSKAKITEEQLTAKLNQAIATGKSDADALNAKLVKLKSDMQRSSSVMQSELQDEICTLQSNLQVTQAGLSSSQHILESERNRLGGQLATTQHELKESRAEAESTLAELRQEREIRMRAQFALTDKTKECDGHILRAKKLDERCQELSDQMQLAKQSQSKTEQISESWHAKYAHMAKARAEAKKNLKHYQLLLKYSAIATFTSGYKMKKLMMAVYEKVVSLCSEAITQPDVPPGTVPGTSHAHSAGGKNTIIVTPSSRSRGISPSAGDANASPAGSRKGSRRNSRRGSVREMDLAAKAAELQSMAEGAGVTQAEEKQAEQEVTSSLSPPNTAGGVRKLPSAIVAAPPASKSTPLNALKSLTGNMGSLPRYSVGPIALTDREWEIHVADLARRSDLIASGGRGISNLQLLQMIEDKLAILSPVVTELRSEVLSSRSTSEGMFQRTLQLSRKNMQVISKFEREKNRTESLRLKLGLIQRELKKLKRIEYMYNRLTDKDSARGPGGSNLTGPPQPVSMKELLALERETDSTIGMLHIGGASYAQPKGAGRGGQARRRAQSAAREDAELDGVTVSEEKELASVLAGAMDDADYLDSSDTDDDAALDVSTPMSPTSSKRKTGSGGGSGSQSNRKPPTPNSTGTTPNTSQGGSNYSWKQTKPIRESILPSNSPSVAGPSAASKSPTRSSGSTKLPPATARTSSTTGKSNVPEKWNGPSPPSTAPSGGSQTARPTKTATGQRAVYVGGSGSTSTAARGEAADEKDREDAEEDESAVRSSPGASMARRSRNPYTIASKSTVRRTEKPTAPSSNRPLSGARTRPTPPAVHFVSHPRPSQPAGAPPRLHTLNNPAANAAAAPSTAAILAAVPADSPE